MDTSRLVGDQVADAARHDHQYGKREQPAPRHRPGCRSCERNSRSRSASRRSTTSSSWCRVTEEARTQSERLLDTVKSSERDAFLNEASSMVEALHQAAIDVDTILDGNSAFSDVIMAIDAGDRGVSVRRLLSRYTPTGAAAMADLYARDRAFTERVDRYLETFDSLLAHRPTASTSPSCSTPPS